MISSQPPGLWRATQVVAGPVWGARRWQKHSNEIFISSMCDITSARDWFCFGSSSFDGPFAFELILDLVAEAARLICNLCLCSVYWMMLALGASPDTHSALSVCSTWCVFSLVLQACVSFSHVSISDEWKSVPKSGLIVNWIYAHYNKSTAFIMSLIELLTPIQHFVKSLNLLFIVYY